MRVALTDTERKQKEKIKLQLKKARSNKLVVCVLRAEYIALKQCLLDYFAILSSHFNMASIVNIEIRHAATNTHHVAQIGMFS